MACAVQAGCAGDNDYLRSNTARCIQPHFDPVIAQLHFSDQLRNDHQMGSIRREATGNVLLVAVANACTTEAKLISFALSRSTFGHVDVKDTLTLAGKTDI